ncbi:MAG: sodium:proton antiporter [Gammaproteobacteria bacterium]|nr:MAG: sodium:proton antiporter [Gammaproteobacteria bacterium]RKZ72421.1 MAG: sodium:proton antiporter [Gammaproteobacteria bacterium]
MNLREISSLVFIVWLGLLLGAVLKIVAYDNILTGGVGTYILTHAAPELGAENIVTSVLLAYRGLDTLGELTVLFVAITAAGLVLGQRRTDAPSDSDAGFILRTAANLLFPFLIILGTYILLQGHFSPGGVFQGGAILAAAFFVPILASPASPLHHRVSRLVEGLVVATFMIICLLALFSDDAFLALLLGKGSVSQLFSAYSLPLLHIVIGFQIGTAFAGILARLQETEASD